MSMDDSSIKRVAVFRALQLGDMLCATPALRALRGGLPSAEITLIGLPWAGQLVDRLPAYLDGFLEFPGWPGLPEQAYDTGAVPRFLQAVQARGFDLAIQLHGNGTLTNTVVALLGATRTAAFCSPGAFVPEPALSVRYPDEGPEICRALHLIEHLGYPSRGVGLEFPVRTADRAALDRLRSKRGLPLEDYVCIHPGARDPARRWSSQAFASVGDALAAQGLSVILTGTAAEIATINAVARDMRRGCLSLGGLTDLGMLAALLEGARLLVCSDTGVSHLAAALGTLSLVVFLSSDPRRWAPLDANRHRALMASTHTPLEIANEAVRLLESCP